MKTIKKLFLICTMALCAFSCKDKDEETQPVPVAVESVSLNKTALTLPEGNSETLTATVEPTDAENKTLTWASSDASVATVSNGKVTAVKEGATTITAKSANGKTAECAVTVVKPADFVAVTGVSLNKLEITLI